MRPETFSLLNLSMDLTHWESFIAQGGTVGAEYQQVTNFYRMLSLSPFPQCKWPSCQTIYSYRSITLELFLRNPFLYLSEISTFRGTFSIPRSLFSGLFSIWAEDTTYDRVLESERSRSSLQGARWEIKFPEFRSFWKSLTFRNPMSRAIKSRPSNGSHRERGVGLDGPKGSVSRIHPNFQKAGIWMRRTLKSSRCPGVSEVYHWRKLV